MSIAPMSSSLSTRQPGPISGSDHQTRHEAAVAIRAALRSGDLDAAKAAFTKLENATSKATAEQSDSSISQLRRALEKGDLGAAKEVLHGAILESRAGKPNTKHDTEPPQDWPVPPGDTLPNGVVGGRLNVTA